MRNSAKALIIHDGKILLNKCTSRFGPYYALPGGGQEIGEILPEAVVREVAEETGYSVETGRLCGIYEIVQNQNESCVNHKIYFIFECKLLDEMMKKPSNSDKYQTGIEWVPLDRLDEVCLFPQSVREAVPKMLASSEVIYLGSDVKG